MARARLLSWSGLAFVVALGPLLITAHSHPFGLSSYVPLVGGTAGGADLGLNRQFWGFTTESLAPWLQAHAPKGATIYIHDTVTDAFTRMQEEKRIRADLRVVGSPGDAELAIVHHELHMGEMDDQILGRERQRRPRVRPDARRRPHHQPLPEAQVAPCDRGTTRA